jgi:L-lactate dehydrogenase complex protein LldG
MVDLEMLCSEAEKLPLNVTIVNDISGAAEAVRNIIINKKILRLFVTNEKMPQEISAIVEDECDIINRNSVHQNLAEILSSCDASLTDADHVISKSATIVIKSKPGAERICSLIPPVHISLVGEKNIVMDLPELFSGNFLFDTAATFITGPSKTADIEKVLVRGVHGPLEEYLIILKESV